MEEKSTGRRENDHKFNPKDFIGQATAISCNYVITRLKFKKSLRMSVIEVYVCDNSKKAARNEQ